MIDHDATTCWEMYPNFGFRPNPNFLTRSHCHAWSAGPAYFLGAYVLGVRGLDPGWSKVLIEPQTVNLDWARGSVPLPGRGRIDVTWRLDRQNGTMNVRLSAPAGVELTIVTREHIQATVERITVG